ncbi:MAG: restriction endonuclease [Coriobacteriia bacterium]|nr:restriction endonuclease [Coriobacteriia bacterium]
MGMLDAAEKVLRERGEPLHYRDITARAITKGLIITSGKTPEATLNAQVALDIKRRGAASRFMRTAPGVFALREWGLAEYERSPAKPEPVKKTMSFTDATEHVLASSSTKTPMHYRDIWEEIASAGLVATEGRTPEATLYSLVLTEIARKKKRGEAPRFVKHGRGFIGLMRWRATGLAFEVERHNAEVKKRLLKSLQAMPPDDFEALVEQLLIAIGFEGTEVTAFTKDKGIDVRGTLVVGDVIRIKMAVQVKRWKHKNNVPSEEVQKVRGSLGTHEHGLIVTTSGFSKGAVTEAVRPDATPVALMDGEQLVELLVEHGIGVQAVETNMLELSDIEDVSE